MALLKHPLRNIFPGHRGAVESGLLSGGATYADKVLGYGPIAYWPLWEAAGPTAECLVNSPAQDGTYTGVTLGQPGIGDGNTAPLFDGINDFVDIYSATFDSVYSGIECTVVIWLKVNAVGVWTDGLTRLAFHLYADGSNLLKLKKHAANNRMQCEYVAGGTWKGTNWMPASSTGWNCLAATVSKTADAFKLHLNGVQQGATQVGLGNYVGALDATRTLIGASAQTAEVWFGYLAHCAVWDTALAQPQILDLATV